MGNENALAIIERAQQNGALVYVNKENFQSSVELYKTEATVIQSKPDEFHNLQGKYMPNRAVTDRIGEAIGVQFIGGDVRTETRDDETAGRRTVFIGTAQGKVRMPDGSWRTSTVEEYEFDPTLRAMLDKRIDYITNENRGAFARTALEYTKVARQRASTGARLRVIRQLTGMPVSFSQGDISKPMVFTRVVQNTAHILDTPEGRIMATAQALGTDVSGLLFGKKPDPAQAIAASTETTPHDVEPENLRSANESEPEHEAAVDTVSLAEQAASGSTEKSTDDARFEELTLQLEELTTSYKDKLDVTIGENKINPFTLAKTELDDFGATIESRSSMIERTKTFLKRCGVAV